MVIISANLSNVRASSIDISRVTNEQIGRCSKVYGPDNKPFYMVLSETDNLTEYKVTYTPGKGFQCTCDAGKEGFAHCKQYCKHIKWACAAAEEEHRAMAEIAIAQASAIIKEAQAPEQERAAEPTIEQLQAVAKDILVDGKPADIATVYRVMTATPKKTNKHQKGFSSKPFSILR